MSSYKKDSFSGERFTLDEIVNIGNINIHCAVEDVIKKHEEGLKHEEVRLNNYLAAKKAEEDVNNNTLQMLGMSLSDRGKNEALNRGLGYMIDDISDIGNASASFPAFIRYGGRGLSHESLMQKSVKEIEKQLMDYNGVIDNRP